MLEVPVAPLPDPQQVRRLLGWDWGIRSLVTATVLDLDGQRLLGVAFLKQSIVTALAEQLSHPTMTKKGLNSASYSGAGLALRLCG
jgi:hypothetical protein